MEALVLFWLLVVLAIVTVVGHGIWVLLAKLFSGLGAESKTPPPVAQHRSERAACPRCLSTLASGAEECAVCGWPRFEIAKDTAPAALANMRSQVERLARLGIIDQETRGKLNAAVAIEAERLRVEPPREIVSLAAQLEPATHSDAEPISTAADEVTPVAAAPNLATARPPEERVRAYAASRDAARASEAATGAQGNAPPTSPPTPRREALSRVLASFMEEKNIRWGELVGGLLIVGCSVALVISFWAEIAARPLLKFVLFNGVTAALFGVGLYTDRKWKIHTTSHGILIIATLLVPLNFLAIAAFTQASPLTDFMSLAGEVVSLVVFSLLTYLAARIIVPAAPVAMSVGVMAPSLMQLLVRRWAGPAASSLVQYSLGAAPVLFYLATAVWPVRRFWFGETPERAPSDESDIDSHSRDGVSWHSFDQSAAQRLFILLGVLSAAAVLPFALLVSKLPPLWDALHLLSPVLVWYGVPGLLTGLLFWRHRDKPLQQGTQTAGIAVGVLGAAVMCAAAVLAWPEPATLLPVSLMLVTVFAATAIAFDIPAALVPAGLALAAAWLIGFHVWRDDVGWKLASYEPMARALLSISSGHALAPLVGVFLLIAWLMRRWQRTEHGLMLAIVGGITLVASLLLVLWFGFGRTGDPGGAVWTLGLYALVALTAAAVIDSLAVAWFGWALLLATLFQAFVFRWGTVFALERPWIAALLAHATLATAVWALFGRERGIGSRWLTATRHCIAPTTAAAAVLIAVAIPSASAMTLAIDCAWLAGVWFAASLLLASVVVLNAAQVALVAAVFWGIVAAVQGREWYAVSARPWLDPWFLAALGVALAAYCALASAVQIAIGRWRSALPERIRHLSSAAWSHSIVGVVEVAIVVVAVGVGWYAAVPGVAQELMPLEEARGAAPAVRVVPPITEFEIGGIPHEHAGGRSGWLLMAAAIAALAIGGWGRENVRLRWSAIVLLLATACPLWAARWEADVSVASALRWISAGFFLVASAAIWARPAVFAARAEGVVRELRDLLVAIVALMYVGMGAYVLSALFSRGGIVPGNAALLPYLLGWAFVGSLIALTIPYAAQGALSLPQTRFSAALPIAAKTARPVMLFLALAPALTLLAFSAAATLDQHPLVGPAPTSWFRRIGHDVAYGVPLAATAITLLGYAIRDRASRFAFVAGLLANVVATLVVLVRLVRGGAALDPAAWILVGQVNALVAGVWAIGWLSAFSWSDLRGRSAEPPVEPGAVGRDGTFRPALLYAQVGLAVALCAVSIMPAVGRLVLAPSIVRWSIAADGVRGWAACLLAITAAMWLHGWRNLSQRGIAAILATFVALFALTATHWDRGNWLAYYWLLGGCCVSSWMLPPVAQLWRRLAANAVDPSDSIAWSSPWTRLFEAATITLALRSLEPNAFSPWGAILAISAISARNIWIAWCEHRGRSMWIAAVLANLAASIWWIDSGHLWTGSTGPAWPLEFAWFNLVIAAAMALVSVVLNGRFQRSEAPGHVRREVGFHRFAAWAGVFVLLCTTSLGLAADFASLPVISSATLNWLAWVTTLAMVLACLWDRRTRWPVAILYCVGLVGVGIYLDRLNFAAPMFHWALGNALAAYALITAYLWSRREAIRGALVRWNVPIAVSPVDALPTDARSDTSDGGQHWLVAANSVLAALVLYLVSLVEITMPQFGMRMVAAYAVGAAGLAFAFLAWGVVRSPLQYTALVFGSLFAVAFGCAWLPPTFDAVWLHRAVATATALAAVTVIYSFGLVKLLRRENEWTRAAQRLVPLLIGAAASLLVIVLANEVVAFAHQDKVPMATPAIYAVLAALLGLGVAALVAALVPGRDPLGLSDRGRTVYVYAAEALAALAFIHIRVTMPFLFRGWFQPYWPLVIMGLAFLGVGLSEVFERRRKAILSEPLSNTGALLPLLPALGFWINSSQIHVHYSLVLLSVGALYASVSVLRKSFLFAVLAAVAANGSLWYLLYRQEGLGLTEHPQLWLIPPALCVLAAGYLNRARLSAEQMAALRYGCAIVIYASSTGDIFINGVGRAPWLPGVLAAISIAGVFAGIVLRVRGFLYLGTAFLLVAIMSVIWYAGSEGRTYVYWISGIVTGAIIIAIFGVFEKRRDDLLRLVERLKQWEV